MKIKTLGLFIAIVLISTVLISNITKIYGSTASTKKYSWGLKLEQNNSQPDVGKINKALLDKYNGIYMGNKDKKYVYLTFDEGYEAGYTPRLLDVLKQNNVKAAFFITGHFLNTNSELVERMISEGHIVGNHTVNHLSLPTVTEEKLKTEVSNLHVSIFEKFNYEMKYIRPPMGEFSEQNLECLTKMGYTNVMWSFAYEDFNEKNQKTEEYAKNKILKNVHNGAVILLHANSETNCKILDYCIKEIKSMGYEFKTLDEFER